MITGTSNDTGISTSPQSYEPGVARPVGLGVDQKIKAKILANEFVKFATLLPKSPFDQDEKFKSIEKDGQLVFVRTTETGQIKSITTWLQAFHVFVAIYCSNHPTEVSNLMTYAQIIQGIAKTCGDDAALDYDEKFRQWRQYAPDMCPWNQKNSELFQDALAKGIENKQKIRKQPFRSPQQKPKYCFSFNNKGICGKGNSCPFPHVCQYCSGKHSRLLCRQKQSPHIINSKPNNHDGAKRTTNARK